MRRRVRVVKNIDERTVWVSPVLSDACISCTDSACHKHGRPFPAANPRGLSVRTGDAVIIGASERAQAVQSFASLFIPVLGALGAYFASAPLERFFPPGAAENLRAAAVIAGLFIPALILYLLSRFWFSFSCAEIIELDRG